MPGSIPPDTEVVDLTGEDDDGPRLATPADPSIDTNGAHVRPPMQPAAIRPPPRQAFSLFRPYKQLPTTSSDHQVQVYDSSKSIRSYRDIPTTSPAHQAQESYFKKRFSGAIRPGDQVETRVLKPIGVPREQPSVPANPEAARTAQMVLELLSYATKRHLVIEATPMPVAQDSGPVEPRANESAAAAHQTAQVYSPLPLMPKKQAFVEPPRKRRRINPAAEKHLKKNTVDTPKATIATLSKVYRNAGEQYLSQVIKTEVFPLVTSSLLPYKEQLDKETRLRLGKEAVKELCDAEFRRHVTESSGTLSAELEKRLAARCNAFISKAAQEIIRESMIAVEVTEVLDPETTSDDDNAESPASTDARMDDHRSRSSSPTTSLSPAADHPPPVRAYSSRKPGALARLPAVDSQEASLTSESALPSVPTRIRRMGRPPRLQRLKAVSTSDREFKSLRMRPVPEEKSVFRKEIQRLHVAAGSADVPRPYLSNVARNDIERGLKIANQQFPVIISKLGHAAVNGSIYHIDLTSEEIRQVHQAVNDVCGIAYDTTKGANLEKLRKQLKHYVDSVPEIAKYACEALELPGRGIEDITAFLEDGVEGKASERTGQLLRVGPILHADPDFQPPPNAALVSRDVNSLLRAREMGGRRAFDSRNRIAARIQDTLSRKAEWTDLSGDIVSISWLSGDRFVCGAISHSDSHNQQYNKPGNLAIGSATHQRLLSMPGHRIPRPLVEKGDNSLDSMRETQDPWLYSSVPSIAYGRTSNKCFTASYDKTVKVWDVDEDGASMNLCGTWQHEGVVNFVVTSMHHDLVATAADVSSSAVRIYDPDHAHISNSSYTPYSGMRQSGSDTWAYFPATIQWALAASVQNLLLVGYSPRSFDVNRGEIPPDKLNSGELCLFNTADGSSIPVRAAKMANVFEVVWHPSQPIFFASTSASGDYDEGVCTQIRIFAPKDRTTFINTKTLDCTASDINELSIMPNSKNECYVTAACTDGKVYVWDTALDDNPMHTLCHGKSIDDAAQGSQPEEADVGVKFVAWGHSADRLYTGSSDGVVKAWNIRARRGQAFLHDVIRLSGGVSAGAFSPDGTKLLLGDATGKVHLLTVESGQEPGENSPTRSREPIVPHAEPAPPTADHMIDTEPEISGRALAREYLDRRQLRIHPDPEIGAVQGENYASARLRCPLEQHDPKWARDYADRMRPIELPTLAGIGRTDEAQHAANLARDMNGLFQQSAFWAGFPGGREIDFGFGDEHSFDFEPKMHVFGEEVYIDLKEEEENSIGAAPPARRFFLDTQEAKEFLKLRREISAEADLRRALATIDLSN